MWEQAREQERIETQAVGTPWWVELVGVVEAGMPKHIVVVVALAVGVQ